MFSAEQNSVQSGAIENVLLRLAQLRREPLDVLAVREILNSHSLPPKARIEHLLQQMNFQAPQWMRSPDVGRLPLLVIDHGRDPGTVWWGIISGEHPDGGFVTSWWDEKAGKFSETISATFAEGCQFARLRFTEPLNITGSATMKIVFSEIFAEKSRVFEMGASTLVVNTLAIAISLYAMQVYDRVVPSAATATLLALTIGVLVAIFFETIGKWVRTALMNDLSDLIDRRLARTVYSRFLHIRLDQLPNSVGSSAARMRGYEVVRGFLLIAITSFLFDFPMAFIALAVLAAIGGWLMLVPFSFFVIGLCIGMFYHRWVVRWAQESTPVQHFKTGLIVESIEGAETIKSGQGGWRMLSRWLDISDEVRTLEKKMRDVSDHMLLIVTMFQQTSYVLLIAFGALLVSGGDLTFGGLIACSILSVRVLTPVAMVPKLLVQWGTTKASVKDLDVLWKLEQDIPEGSKPIILDNIRGQFNIQNLVVSYDGNVILDIPQLRINMGERVAIVGAIGVGKTALLRILSGMYRPQSGRVILDGVDIEHIAKTSLAKHMGYIPQEGRLFAGSLRENLLLGLQDPGDAKLLEVAELSGLMSTVISPHPHGLERVIHEGGAGLSGGQRQLVHVTRAMLREPSIWLMDEPTAHMDQGLERQVLGSLRSFLVSQSMPTMILVTHKMQLVDLVDRLIVLGGTKVVMDGPRDQVLQELGVKPKNNISQQVTLRPITAQRLSS